jgi:hypothetical protein
MLNGRRLELFADAFQYRVACLAPGLGYADLDQLVRGQAAIDLQEHRVGEPAFADEHDRMQFVGARPKRAALGR